MLIRIDAREGDLHTMCVQMATAFPSLQVETAQLPLGDVIICEDDGCERLIVERKTLNDLAASIKDGRYEEQGYRLQQCELDNHRIFYLIEGRLDAYKPGKWRVERKALLSSFVSITCSKGFSLYRSDSMVESAEWIVAYAEKLGRNAKPKANYAAVSSRAKKAHITSDNILPIMLSQVPGVSVGIAEAIVAKYPTLQLLLAAPKDDLYAIMIPTKTGKARRISKPACDNLSQYLALGA